jgi:hypothetical protein
MNRLKSKWEDELQLHEDGREKAVSDWEKEEENSEF